MIVGQHLQRKVGFKRLGSYNRGLLHFNLLRQLKRSLRAQRSTLTHNQLLLLLKHHNLEVADRLLNRKYKHLSQTSSSKYNLAVGVVSLIVYLVAELTWVS